MDNFDIRSQTENGHSNTFGKSLVCRFDIMLTFIIPINANQQEIDPKKLSSNHWKLFNSILHNLRICQSLIIFQPFQNDIKRWKIEISLKSQIMLLIIKKLLLVLKIHSRKIISSESIIACWKWMIENWRKRKTISRGSNAMLILKWIFIFVMIVIKIRFEQKLNCNFNSSVSEWVRWVWLTICAIMTS
jgi:hypothetical protein